MAQVLIRYCDQHQQNDENRSAEAWAMTITPPGEKIVGFEVDLCPDCSKPLRDLIEHFEEIARVIKNPLKQGKAEGVTTASSDGGSGGAWQCPDCEYNSDKKDALRSHGTRAHNKLWAELMGDTVEAKYQCLRCEQARQFTSGTGFAAHRRQAHALTTDDPLLPGEVLADPTATTLPYGKTGKKDGENTRPSRAKDPAAA